MNILGLRESIMNPKLFMQNVMQNSNVMKNPLAKNAIHMMQNNDSKGLQEMAENLCKQHGTTAEEVKQMIAKNLGMN